MISGTFTTKGLVATSKNVQGVVRRIKDASVRGMWRGMLRTRQVIQLQYLQGPRPVYLGVVTGRLLNSIKPEVSIADDRIIGTISSDVPYARYHELGFHGIQHVREHYRSHFFVRAHDRRVNYKGRPFIAPAFGRMFSVILNEINQELEDV